MISAEHSGLLLALLEVVRSLDIIDQGSREIEKNLLRELIRVYLVMSARLSAVNDRTAKLVAIAQLELTASVLTVGILMGPGAILYIDHNGLGIVLARSSAALS
jgi:hypothetical protein